MEIKERIKNIKEYFREMQITTTSDGQQVIYVIVRFPNEWIIDEDIESKFGITISEGTMMNEYYFCADIDTGEDAIFDAIEYNVAKMKAAIERAQLLSVKTKELRALFENEDISLETLKTLTFTYDTAPKEELIFPSKRGRKNNSKQDSEPSQENIMEENSNNE